MKTKSFFLVSCLCFILFAGCSFAQNMSNSNIMDLQQQSRRMNNFGRGNDTELIYPEEGIVELTTSVLVNTIPDGQTMIFSLAETGKTAADAEKAVSEKVDAFRADLKKSGFADEDFYVDILSLIPVYEYQKEGTLSIRFTEIPIGFKLEQNVHIRIKKSEDGIRVLQTAAQNQIYDLADVQYFVNDLETIKRQARAKAFALHAEKEKMYRELGILSGKETKKAGENMTVFRPELRYTKYEAFQSTYNQELSGRKIRPATKKQTVYYEPIPSDRFDAIVNPEILEPVMQTVYQLRLLYTAAEEPAAKTKYVLIGADGKFQTLDLEK